MRPTRPNRNPERRRRGAALLLVLGAVLIVGLAVAGLLQVTRASAAEQFRAAQRFEAEWIAESGLALGFHPGVTPTDPVLHQELEGGYRLDVTITSEQGRIPILGNTTATRIAALTDLFVLWGVDRDDAGIAAESLADWMDADDDPRPQGAETDHYAGLGFPRYPRNAAFASLDEMVLVRGMDRVARVRPGWRDAFTLHGDGQIDVNAAEAAVIHAYAGVTLADAERFVATRNGADGVLGTEDDQLYRPQNVGEAVQLLGIPQARLQAVGQLFTLEGTALRVESKATVGDLAFTRVVVAERATGRVLARQDRTFGGD
jgi:general secretion pathway protein K